MFTDSRVARVMSMEPHEVELETFHSPTYPGALGQFANSVWSIVMLCGALNEVWSGMPASTAAASTNGLNVDPAWKPAESPYLVGTE